MSQFETVLVYPGCSRVIIINLPFTLMSVSIWLINFIVSPAMEPAEMRAALKQRQEEDYWARCRKCHRRGELYSTAES